MQPRLPICVLKLLERKYMCHKNIPLNFDFVADAAKGRWKYLRGWEFHRRFSIKESITHAPAAVGKTASGLQMPTKADGSSATNADKGAGSNYCL